MSATLIVQFCGWCLVRIPTDPDPQDERRGVTGYTFAFAGEPDLDSVLRMQPPLEPRLLRSYSPSVGVLVSRAIRVEDGRETPVEALKGARVELLDSPRFENRNWILTLPGFEPIVPFHLQIAGQGVEIRRKAPLDRRNPNTPVWEVEERLLTAQGARGMEYEPETIGRTTGTWDSFAAVQARHRNLTNDRDALEAWEERRKAGKAPDPEHLRAHWPWHKFVAEDPPVDTAIANLEGRIGELKIGLSDRMDRRVFSRYFVERFGFPMWGEASVSGDWEGLLGGELTTKDDKPWEVNFWMGAWDPDVLCCFLQGSLSIPYENG